MSEPFSGASMFCLGDMDTGKLIEKGETKMKEYKIIKVDNQNYSMFDDMVFWRVYRRERTNAENQRQ
jgi:hypothetical protein